MAIAEILGLNNQRSVRYGVVGLGSIAQEAMLPGEPVTFSIFSCFLRS
jgi:hypothetical protein